MSTRRFASLEHAVFVDCKRPTKRKEGGFQPHYVSWESQRVSRALRCHMTLVGRVKSMIAFCVSDTAVSSVRILHDTINFVQNAVHLDIFIHHADICYHRSWPGLVKQGEFAFDLSETRDRCVQMFPIKLKFLQLILQRMWNSSVQAAPMPKASRKQTIIRAAAAASDEAQPQSRRAALAFFAASMIGLGAVEAAQANAAAPKSATGELCCRRQPSLT